MPPRQLPSDAMEAVATTSEHMGSVLQQLQEAFACSEIDESSRQEVIQERSQDLMDACLTELLRCVAAQKIKVEVRWRGREAWVGVVKNGTILRELYQEV